MKTDFTLLTLSENFPDEESCIRYFEKMRWGDEVISPYDSNSKVYKVVMVSINARILEDTLMLKLVLHLPILNCL